MPNPVSLGVLLVSTATIAFVHALAPDHWVPFVSIGRAQKWSTRKLLGVTLLSGCGHVISSIVIGMLGLMLGLGLSKLEAWESRRAEIAGALLLGFGIVYTIWGLMHARRHNHALPPKNSVTLWTLFAIFVLGPCEPLIPLMFLAATHSTLAVILATVLFGVITLVMMMGQAWLVYAGVGFARFKKMEHYGHALAGAVIVLTGGMVMFLGI